MIKTISFPSLTIPVPQWWINFVKSIRAQFKTQPWVDVIEFNLKKLNLTVDWSDIHNDVAISGDEIDIQIFLLKFS